MDDGDGRCMGGAGWACSRLGGRREGGPPGSGSGRWGPGPYCPSNQQSTGLGRNRAAAGGLDAALAGAGHNSATLNLSLPAIK